MCFPSLLSEMRPSKALKMCCCSLLDLLVVTEKKSKMTIGSLLLKTHQVNSHSPSPVLIPALTVMLHTGRLSVSDRETPTPCGAPSILVFISYVSHSAFRDLLPWKRDLFTSMCRFLDFHNSWQKSLIYLKLLIFFWLVYQSYDYSYLFENTASGSKSKIKFWSCST